MMMANETKSALLLNETWKKSLENCKQEMLRLNQLSIEFLHNIELVFVDEWDAYTERYYVFKYEEQYYRFVANTRSRLVYGYKND
jgi:hypothetical protein